MRTKKRKSRTNRQSRTKRKSMKTRNIPKLFRTIAKPIGIQHKGGRDEDDDTTVPATDPDDPSALLISLNVVAEATVGVPPMDWTPTEYA